MNKKPMKNLSFEKYGLSPEKVEQLRAYKILPDKRREIGRASCRERV